MIVYLRLVLCVSSLLLFSAKAEQSHSSKWEAVNYCKILNCFKKHVGCNNNGSLGRACPDNVTLVDMETIKSPILARYNNIRDLVAAGDAKDFFYAVHMAEMQWSEELAYLAELNVKSCESKRDRCRSTSNFPNAGQSNAEYFWRETDDSPSDNDLIEKLIKEWLVEIKYSEMFILRKYPKIEPRPLQHHFALAADEKNTHIGCAAVRFNKDRYENLILTCNFATKTCRNSRIYNYMDESSYIASECKTGRSQNYENLCSTKEKYVQKRFYEIRPTL